MPKNTGKGGKQRKRGKNANEQSKREIVTASEGEAYACVIAPMGNYQMSIRLDDMTTATGIVRGALRKKVWIVSGDLIRVQLRTGFDDGTVDIVGKYTHNEAQELVKNGVVPQVLTQGANAQTESTGAGTKAGAQKITFVQQTGAAAAAEVSKDKNQQDPNARKGNVDMAFVMKNPNRGGVGIGDSDDEDGPEENPMRGWKANKRQGDDDSDEEDDEEYEEGEEDEEDEEETEEEEDEEGANADAYYDGNRADNSADWKKYHNNKKDMEHKQRNKRAKESQVGGAKGVQASDIADI